MIDKWEYEEGDGLISIKGDSGSVILSNEYSYHRSDDEFHAIGKLAASAPDLLEALQGILEIYDDHSGKIWTNSSKRRALDAGRAAVKLALGEKE